ncbi:MAG TPA: hypothetical protein PK345_00565 [Bacteroidales bacterium]|jgi:hydrogenase-4 component E|nr:hypothetical protein [Bacteroidales bacterium]NLH33903.1 hypothetical protein [Lentimicrobium sp.]OQC37537.1 MAG: hydrogenase 4 membrane subunit [Bacteroidetes bacterium ADurb.Bin041]MBP7874086.1 hypothetical protein [Bacteroidales bacterium]MCZ2283623.1 hypothetical protein [Bacteroidales bacterium]
MLNFLIVLFAINLIYVSVADRFRIYSRLIAVQGILLMGIALIELQEVSTLNLILILAETLIFKAIVVPYLLFSIIHRTGIYKVHNRALPGFFSLILTIIALVLSIVIANILENPHIDTAYLTIALFTMFVGVLLIIGHKLIFSHMIGFLIIENAVFMLSMAVGKEMTMLINIGILLDVFVSVLVISILINRIGTEFNKFEVQDLTSLKH